MSLFRWRSEGNAGKGTGEKMSWQSVPLTPLVLPLEPLTSLASSPFFPTSEDINGRGGGGPLTKWGWRGRGPVCHDIFWRFSRGVKRDKLNGTNGAKFADFRCLFADFRFSWELQHLGGADFRRQPQIFAENRRQPQVFAENRRQPQIFAETGFVPFSLSLLIPP